MKKLSPPFELVKKAINLFIKKENLIFLVLIYLPLVPFSILSVVQRYIPSAIVNSNSPWLIFGLVIIQLLYFLVYIFVAIAGIIGVAKVVKGGNLSVRDTFKVAWKKYWIFLLVAIVLLLIQLLGFVLLIIPGILVAVWFAFSRFIVVESNVGVKEAFMKSKNLVKGYFWRVLGRVIIFGLFAAVVQLVLSILPYGVGSTVSVAAGGLFLLPSYLLFEELSA